MAERVPRQADGRWGVDGIELQACLKNKRRVASACRSLVQARVKHITQSGVQSQLQLQVNIAYYQSCRGLIFQLLVVSGCTHSWPQLHPQVMYSCTVLCRQPCSHVAKPPLPAPGVANVHVARALKRRWDKKIGDCAPPHAESESVPASSRQLLPQRLAAFFESEAFFSVSLVMCFWWHSQPFARKRRRTQTSSNLPPTTA